jgi:hypothetical protein
MEVSGQFHAPAALPPRKDPQYLLFRRLGGPQSHSGRRKFQASARNWTLEPPIIHLIAQHYTNWAILALLSVVSISEGTVDAVLTC